MVLIIPFSFSRPRDTWQAASTQTCPDVGEAREAIQSNDECTSGVDFLSRRALSIAPRRRNDCFYNQVLFFFNFNFTPNWYRSHDRTLYHITLPILFHIVGMIREDCIYLQDIHIPALCASKHRPDRKTGPGGKRWNDENDESMTIPIQVEPNRPHRSIWFASHWIRERLLVPTFFFFFCQRSPTLQIEQIDNSITRLVSTQLLSSSQRWTFCI
jgi:hypothetical protein